MCVCYEVLLDEFFRLWVSKAPVWLRRHLRAGNAHQLPDGLITNARASGFTDLHKPRRRECEKRRNGTLVQRARTPPETRTALIRKMTLTATKREFLLDQTIGFLFCLNSVNIILRRKQIQLKLIFLNLKINFAFFLKNL